ncbi:MAG: insulinase family protein [Lentisphaeria bacterium]|nr:insulinase family protein [Candidatus Neomarinimicrobiota bacterium]MCF7841683.1 insulinase family protein [Lentisphaeria bacterium]
MIHRFYRPLILVMVVGVVTSCSWFTPGKENGKNRAEFKQALPVDPAVRTGQLPNGLHYYIRYNPKPEHRAELRLAVNAGSILENDDQQGLAHFVEHMAFNGSENFEKQALVDYLESIGMRFGPDLNAYTSFDETVYMLQVPTDSSEELKTAFQILEDWGHLLSFNDEEIDKERGVIIEEWRLGRGADQRMRDEQFPIILKDSRYAERLPIGKKEILETFHYETLRRFYKDWYRPDLMAVVAVGDFDMDAIEGLIQSHFGNLTNPGNEREREFYPVPDHEETLFAIATDKEATRNQVAVYYMHDVQPEETVGHYRERLMGSLYNAMFSDRLNELAKQSDAPFLYGYSGQGQFVRTKEVYLLAAGVADNGIETGLEALLREAKRVHDYGFTQSELARQKKALLRQVEQAYNERDKTESRNLAREYVSHYLNGEPIPGIEYEYAITQKLLPTITLEDVNRLADEWITPHNRVVTVNAPEKEGVSVPSDQELAAVLEAVSREKVEPYTEAVNGEPLLAQEPAPGQVVSESSHSDVGIVEWTLSNGVRVILKPTDFKNDEVRFTAFSPGGTSLVPDSNYIAAETAADILYESGLGNFDRISLDKKLTGQVVNVKPWLKELEEGLNGSASPADLETLFQLIYLHFTAPRADENAYAAYKGQLEAYVANRSARPESAFQDTIQVTLAQHHFRARPWSPEVLREMDLGKSYRVFRERFADAGDFTFIFVGNFEPEKLKPLVEKYLGALPALNRNEKWRDLNIDPPAGVITKEIFKGEEAKSSTRIVFNGTFDWNRQTRYDIISLVDLMRIRLREILREDMGGTYSVGIWAETEQFPEPAYKINITFGSAPDRVEELVQAVMDEIEHLKKSPPDEEYLVKIKETQRRSRETNLKQNGYWIQLLKFYYANGFDVANINKFNELVENLAGSDLQQSARRYLDTDHYVQVILYPASD